jgi:hypothetical protein
LKKYYIFLFGLTPLRTAFILLDAAPEAALIPVLAVATPVPCITDLFLESLGNNEDDIKYKEVKNGVAGFMNPALYPFKDFEQHAYDKYRNNIGIGSQEYQKELNEIKNWISKVEDAIKLLKE